MGQIYSVREIKDTLNPIFSRYGVRNAILFGSYAKDAATERSDIDLLVNSGLRGMAFFGLLEDVASSLRVPVDLIDVTQLEKNSPIEQEIKNSGVVIYGR